jgi:hypothetical protein
VPNAIRSNDSTITIRVNEVIISKIEGKNDKAESNTSVCKLTEYKVLLPALGVAVTAGSDGNGADNAEILLLLLLDAVAMVDGVVD